MLWAARDRTRREPRRGSELLQPSPPPRLRAASKALDAWRRYPGLARACARGAVGVAARPEQPRGVRVYEASASPATRAGARGAPPPPRRASQVARSARRGRTAADEARRVRARRAGPRSEPRLRTARSRARARDRADGPALACSARGAAARRAAPSSPPPPRRAAAASPPRSASLNSAWRGPCDAAPPPTTATAPPPRRTALRPAHRGQADAPRPEGGGHRERAPPPALEERSGREHTAMPCIPARAPAREGAHAGPRHRAFPAILERTDDRRPGSPSAAHAEAEPVASNSPGGSSGRRYGRHHRALDRRRHGLPAPSRRAMEGPSVRPRAAAGGGGVGDATRSAGRAAGERCGGWGRRRGERRVSSGQWRIAASRGAAAPRSPRCCAAAGRSPRAHRRAVDDYATAAALAWANQEGSA